MKNGNLEIWKFLYTKEITYKKAVNKNNSLKRNKSHFIIVDGKDYADCLYKAKNECKFNKKQLIGSNPIKALFMPVNNVIDEWSLSVMNMFIFGTSN